jgi:hypothetical protein
MKSRFVLRWMTLFMIVALLVPGQLSLEGEAKGLSPAPDRARVAKALRSAPVMFIENIGQFSASARFQVRGDPATMWLAEDAIWFTIDTEAKREDEPLRGVNLKLSFPGANPHPRLEPFDRLDTVVSYLTGSDPAQWRPAMPVWGGVRYLDLYPGVDLVVGATLPWRLEVRDGADLSVVRLRVEGADAVALGSGQHLRLTTALGDFILPLLTLEGTRPAGQPSALGVSPARVFNTDGTFEIAHPFSASTPNPQPFDGAQGRAATRNLQSSGLLYSTFVGGSENDQGLALALDGDGNVMVTGSTRSSDFPTFPTPGAYDTSHNRGRDVFVLKLAADGGSLLYSTFVGGSSDDWGSALALDRDGNAVVTGSTYSSDFPTFPTPGAYDTSHNGSSDVFVLKLAADGSSLLYSTFVGGINGDQGLALALDGDDNAMVTGQTQSPGFPTFPTPGAYDTSHNGGRDVFVLKLAADGGSLLYSTFVGGSNGDQGLALALDGADNAVVAGWTYSSNFPTTPGAYDTSHNGFSDVFVLKLAADGGSLLYSTFVGGSEDDQGLALALDRDGNAVATGGTQSSSDFPTTDEAYDASHNGGWDVFVLKLAAVGDSLLYSTFVGGNNWDNGSALALDGDDNAVVAGETWSDDFPTTDDTTHNGKYDVFVLKLKLATDEDPLLYSTVVGGGENDRGLALALAAAGNAVVTGETWSDNFPTTGGAYDGDYYEGGDAFVLDLDLEFAPITPTPTPTDTPTATPTSLTPTDTPTPTSPTPTDTPTPTYTPIQTDTPTPTYTPTPTDTPTPTPTLAPTPVVMEYCCSPGDRIYRIDFDGYDCKSASNCPLKHVTSPPAPQGWNQLYVDPASPWQPASEVWWDDWNASDWNSLPGDGHCKPIGLQDKNGNQEGQSGITHLYRRKFTLSPPYPGMQMTQAVLEMWSDNKTEWWWGGGGGWGSIPVSYNKEGYIGQIDLFLHDLINPDGGTYVLAIQNSNDRVCSSPNCNPQGTACYLRVTWAIPSPSQVYLPLILKGYP